MSWPIIQQAPFTDRVNFAWLLKTLELTSIAVEIGTHQGEFAADFLQHWPGHLYCVDPWEPGYDPFDPASNGDREDDLKMAIQTLKTAGVRGRAVIMRSTSMSAIDNVPKPQFVYVDGCHQPESVREDLEGWWEVLRPGGILAGHDFICPGEPEGGWGKLIQPVVFEFAESRGLNIFIVVEKTNQPWSYYLRKPE